MSWDRNAELWKQKRDEVEKQLEEAELETLKQFFQVDENDEENKKKMKEVEMQQQRNTSLRDFENRRIVLHPV